MIYIDNRQDEIKVNEEFENKIKRNNRLCIKRGKCKYRL